MKTIRPAFVLLLILCGAALATEWGEDEDSWEEDQDVAEDYCMGDLEGIQINKQGCPEHVQQHPTSCYDVQIYAVCCHSCDVLFLENEASRAGCEYGDHNENATFTDDLDGTTFTCKDVATTKGHACSQDDVRSVCCATCDKKGEQASDSEEVIPDKIQEESPYDFDK